MSKLPFKKKLTDEEEEYETDEEEEFEEELDEEIQSENNERTQVVNTSDLESEDEDIDAEDEEELEEPQNLKEKIQFQVNQLLKKFKKKSGDDQEGEEASSEDETQAEIKKPVNRNKLIVQIIIVLGIVYFVAEEFMKEEEPQIPTPQLKARPDKLPKKTEEPSLPPTESTDSETPPADASFESTTQPSEDVSDNDLGLSEALPADDSLTPPSSDVTPPSEETPSVSEDFSITPSDVVTGEDSSVTNNDTPVVEETPPVTAEDTGIPSTDFNENGMGQGQGDMFGDLESPVDESSGDLTEKILQDLEDQTKSTKTDVPTEYVSPPDYEYPGRGLVYNCRAMHWACVDAPSYKICEQNASYLKSNNKAPECYPFNVYETSRGCTAMQNRMVSSGASTDFCKEF